jgi:single-strand DNA-binding protein
LASSINVVVISGRLGRDSETKFTNGGTAVTNFSLATNRTVKEGGEFKDVTDWHNIVAFKKEALANYLLKGKEVTVTGRIQTRSYDGKDGQKRYITEIIADQIQLHGGNGSQAAPSAAKGGYNPEYDTNNPIDDDVPF